MTAPLGQYLRAFTGTINPVAHATGICVAYSEHPQVCIQTESGEQVWWRRDLTEVVKPPEPLGLGAVVEDGAEERWVRTDVCRAGTSWSTRSRDGGFTNANYADIDAVRVLSEGVAS